MWRLLAVFFPENETARVVLGSNSAASLSFIAAFLRRPAFSCLHHLRGLLDLHLPALR